MRYQYYLRSRYTALLGYAGGLWVIIALAMVAPLLVIPFYPEDAQHAWAFLVVGLPLAIIGYWLRRKIPKENLPGPTFNEGTVIIVLAWIMALFVGCIPFMLIEGMSFTHALFESTSGWSTTGLTVIDPDSTPRILLMYRSITHLVGGAGFAIIVLSALAGPAGSGLSSAEGRDEQLAPNVQHSATVVLRIYLIYIIGGIIAYIVVGMPAFDAINHAFAAVATGGFSTHTASIGFYDSPAIEAVSIALMLLGSINFLTAYVFFKGKFYHVYKNGEIRLFAILFPLAMFLIFVGTTSSLYPDLAKQARVTVFEVATAISTTGFATVNYTEWNDIGWLVLILLMLIGGGTGSTAGGIKLYRLYVILKALWWEMKRPFMPEHAVNQPILWRGDQRMYLNDAHMRRNALYIVMYMAFFFLGVIILALSGYSLKESMFEFASTIAGAGLSVGVVTANSPDGVLWLVMVGMLLGRLEFFAVIIGVTKLFRDTKAILPTIRNRQLA